MFETDKAYRPVIEAERLAQQAGAELTTLIRELHPPGLDRKALPAAIRGHVEVWSRQNKIEAEMNIDEKVSVALQTERLCSASVKITILLVDDHAVVRQGVRTFLETQADLSVVGEAGSGKEALAAQHVPDVS